MCSGFSTGQKIGEDGLIKIQVEVIVFSSSHFLFLGCCFILIPAKMKHSMENYPVKLFIIGGAYLPGIILYPIHTDIYFRFNRGAWY